MAAGVPVLTAVDGHGMSAASAGAAVSTAIAAVGIASVAATASNSGTLRTMNFLRTVVFVERKPYSPWAL
jgi:hypothetical protein